MECFHTFSETDEKNKSLEKKEHQEMMTLKIEDCYDLKTRLVGAERFNFYLEFSGNLWKEACERLKFKLNTLS